MYHNFKDQLAMQRWLEDHNYEKVIHCKDCVFYNDIDFDKPTCNLFGPDSLAIYSDDDVFYVSDGDFCCWSKRKCSES